MTAKVLIKTNLLRNLKKKMPCFQKFKQVISKFKHPSLGNYLHSKISDQLNTYYLNYWMNNMDVPIFYLNSLKWPPGGAVSTATQIS